MANKRIKASVNAKTAKELTALGLIMLPEQRAEFIEELMLQFKGFNSLTEDELRWVRLAIEKEAQTVALRKAIIEKSLTSLVWMGIVGIGYVLLDFAKQHGLK